MPRLMFERPRRIEWEELGPTFGRLVAEPFEKGYALTVGNSLRRALLAAIPGSAVTWVRVDGLSRPHGRVPGIEEDAAALLLNVKRMVVRIPDGARVTRRASLAGPGSFTAGLLAGPDLEVVNPDLVLATVSAGATLALEVAVATGRGYCSADRHPEPPPRGALPLDAAFSPIRRVNYTVEMSRLGNITDYEKLVVEITTDGSLPPDQALLRTARLLRDHFELFTPAGAEEEDDEPAVPGEATRGA
jgi:DNA-directed RNA polymerase subunit alpha